MQLTYIYKNQNIQIQKKEYITGYRRLCTCMLYHSFVYHTPECAQIIDWKQNLLEMLVLMTSMCQEDCL